MTNDLKMTAHDGCFTLRAAAVIIQNNCLLAVRDKTHDSYYTVGGRVHLGESTLQAALREAREETGCACAVDRLLFVQERFFTFDSRQHHEVCFYYLMHPLSAARDGAHTDQSWETLHLLPLDTLGRVRLIPAALRDILHDMPASAQHIITHE